jgi:hypothetical protein
LIEIVRTINPSANEASGISNATTMALWFAVSIEQLPPVDTHPAEKVG